MPLIKFETYKISMENGQALKNNKKSYHSLPKLVPESFL